MQPLRFRTRCKRQYPTTQLLALGNRGWSLAVYSLAFLELGYNQIYGSTALELDALFDFAPPASFALLIRRIRVLLSARL